MSRSVKNVSALLTCPGPRYGTHPNSGPYPICSVGDRLAGGLHPVKGQRKYLLVAIDYFTKWVEAEAMASTTSKSVSNFVWKSIISRFGLPNP